MVWDVDSEAGRARNMQLVSSKMLFFPVVGLACEPSPGLGFSWPWATSLDPEKWFQHLRTNYLNLLLRYINQAIPRPSMNGEVTTGIHAS